MPPAKRLLPAAAALLLAAALPFVAFDSQPERDAGVSAPISIDADTIEAMKTALEESEPAFTDLASLLLSRSSNLSDQEALENKFKPRKDTPVYQLSFPFDWSADPFNDRNWRSQLQAWRSISPSVVALENTRDVRHLRHIMATIADWHDYHIVQGRKTFYSWFDKPTGERALILAYLLDLSRREPSLFSETDLDVLLTLAAHHIAVLRDPEFFKNNNHGIFQAHGLMALCTALEGWPPCDEARGYAAKKMGQLMRSQFGEEGVHLEHSPGYHFFALINFEKVFASGWYDEYPEIGALLAQAKENAAWMVDARGRIPNIGDSEPAAPQFRVAPLDPGRCAGRDPPCLLARRFREAGYAVIRTAPDTPKSEAMSLFLTCSYHSGVHKHDDELSIEWLVRGQAFITGPGKYSYDASPERRYLLSRPAHATAAFRDLSTAPSERRPFGGCIRRAFADREGRGVAEGEAQYSGGALKHRRQVLLSPDGSLDVTDTFSGRKKDAYTLWWHFDPAVEARAISESVYSAVSGETEVMVFFNGEGCESKLVKGLSERRMQGWTSSSYRKLTPRWSLGFECPASARRVQTRFIVQYKD